MTTFNGPYRRHGFLRLPYGIKSALEVFQQTMNPLFSDSPCEIIVDDMPIWGETEGGHDAKLCKVLERARGGEPQIETQEV